MNSNILICIVIFTVYCYLFSMQSVRATIDIPIEKYSPDLQLKRIPESPEPNSNLNIYAKVFDKYGKIQSAILSYSLDQINWTKNNMTLYDGTLSNGTFLGSIPSYKENSTVRYRLYFEDDLGYSYYSAEMEYMVAKDIIAPVIDNPIFPDYPIFSPIFSIKDNGSGVDVENTTLYYSIDNDYSGEDSDIMKTNSIHLDLIKGNKWNGEYKSLSPIPMESPGNVTYYLESYDYSGNGRNKTGDTGISFMPTIESIDDYKQFVILVEVNELDLSNMTADARFTISGTFPNPQRVIYKIDVINSDINSASRTRPSSIGEMFTIGKRFGENNFAIPLDNSNPFGAVSSPYNKSLNLIGEPARYPFDKYYLNLVFAIPRKDTSVNNIVDFNDLVRASWSPPDYNASYPLSIINRDKLIPVFNRIFGLDQKGSLTICDVIKRTPQMVNLSQIPFSSCAL